MVIGEGNCPILLLCLSELEETWLEVLHIVEGVIRDHYLLGAIIVEIHCEVDERSTRLRVDHNVITNVNLDLWRHRALEGDMLYIDGDASIDPARIYEPIIRYRNIAVILRVDHRCISTNIKTRENIIMPYLIISDERLSVETTL